MRVFLIAGEASGDKLGAALMAGLKQLRSDVEFRGVAGVLMQGEGMESLFDMGELSVMGLAEVLPKYRHLKRRIRQTAQAVLDWKPDVLITIDSPDFCLRVARAVRGNANIRTVHYVAPSVWAWRPGRAEKMAPYIDQVLALLPFEPPYMEAAGMQCDFVGHPVVAEPVVTPEQAMGFRKENGLGEGPVILALPGSRRQEITRMAPVFGEALREVLKRSGPAHIVVPAAAPVAPMVRQMVESWPGKPLILDPRDMPTDTAETRKRHAFAAADVALAASGTVSLELSAAATPMVIAHDVNWLSWQIMSRMIKVDTVTLPNLICAKNIIPEFLGPACRPGPIAAALVDLMQNQDARTAQLAAMKETMLQLGRGGDAPGLRAARAVLEGLAHVRPASRL